MENDEVPTAPIPLPKDQERRHFEWTTEIKVTLIMFNNEERAKGRGFTEKSQTMGSILPRNRDAIWQKLHKNAARFKNRPEVMNLILVKMYELQQEETKHEEDLPEKNHETGNDINTNNTDNNGVVDKQTDKLTEDDKELKQFFRFKLKF